VRSKKVNSGGKGFTCFPRMGKRGSLETKEIIEIVLAGAGIFVLIFLLWALIAPNFNQEEEAAKGYSTGLKAAIEEADRDGRSTFSLWGVDTKMVYFRGVNRVKLGEDIFYETENKDKNRICFCYENKPGDKNWQCDGCILLDKQVDFLLQGGPLKDTVDHIYFFNDSRYWKYDNYNAYILWGYPTSIGRSWSGIPNDLDAAVKFTETVYFFFKENNYWKYVYDPANNLDKVVSTGTIFDDWGGIKVGSGLDAAAKGLGDDTFLFKGDMYWRYDSHTLGSPVAGKKISDKGNWPGLPKNFSTKAAVRFRNYIYFFNGTKYWKYDLDSNSVAGNSFRETSTWGSEFETLDAAAPGKEISSRYDGYKNAIVFEEGCKFNIISKEKEKKYIMEVTCGDKPKDN
jgi:hypothetical protein